MSYYMYMYMYQCVCAQVHTCTIFPLLGLYSGCSRSRSEFSHSNLSPLRTVCGTQPLSILPRTHQPRPPGLSLTHVHVHTGTCTSLYTCIVHKMFLSHSLHGRRAWLQANECTCTSCGYHMYTYVVSKNDSIRTK